MAKGIRGLEERHEQRQQQLIRDTRPLFSRFLDYLKDPNSAIVMMFATAAATFFLPSVNDIILLIGILFFTICMTGHRSLPFRMPEHSNMMDDNDPAPGSKKARKARGICFFGNEQHTGLELWFNNEDMRTHCLIFGSTGSGKTQTLLSLSYNALIQGSGFIYVDGKGDNSLFAQVFSMARSMAVKMIYCSSIS